MHDNNTAINQIKYLSISKFNLSTNSIPNPSHKQTRSPMFYLYVPYKCDTGFNRDDFFPVDIHNHKKGLTVVGTLPTKKEITMPTKTHDSITSLYKTLHPSLKEICGKVQFPLDDGRVLIQGIKDSNKAIFAASDTFHKEGRSSHAWRISTGLVSDINNPLKHISGSGPVQGFHKYLSSTRGELQGITAITIISKLISEFLGPLCNITAITDNQGVIRRCSRCNYNFLRSHRLPNIDPLPG
jgi:hypothetical protein